MRSYGEDGGVEVEGKGTAGGGREGEGAKRWTHNVIL